MVSSGYCGLDAWIGDLHAGTEIAFVSDSSVPETDPSCLIGGKAYSWIKLAWPSAYTGGFGYTISGLADGSGGDTYIIYCPEGTLVGCAPLKCGEQSPFVR